ncbi:MAG TPA: shikimate kinase [Ferruginibacter sp.]|nr:shikimate kinase [Ferruginibacter sp.]
MNSSNNSPLRGLGGEFFLIGFMGSGKSYWGKIWAEKSGLNFIDLDELIEAKEKKSIADIFAINGEDHFRDKEAGVLKSLAGTNNCIIACGGGTACYHDNMKWMNEHGTTVYLESTVKEIFDRVLREQEKRPLIKKMGMTELYTFIEQKLKEREPFYNKATYSLPTEELNVTSFEKLITHNL